MIISTLKQIKNEINSNNIVFILLMMTCGFCISADYGIIRPACDSIFISTYTTKYIPYAWILSVPINFVIIHLYNKFLPKYGCLKIFTATVLLICCFNVFSAYYINTFSFLAFLQYVWKDIYILLMFKQMWSLIHTTLNTREAKYLFGLIFGMGGIGSVFGGLISGFFAVTLSSKNLLFFTCPIYLIILLAYSLAQKRSGMQGKAYKDSLITKTEKPKEVFKLIKNSKLLTFVLLIVIFMQLTRGFVDFQFSVFLENNIASLDLRTQLLGKLVSITNAITSCFQFFGTFLLIHFFGLRKIHLMIPTTLGLNALLLILYPVFPIATYSYIATKSIDYSIFSIIREMLYVPMRVDEKYRAKTIIDVFAYRSARAFTSFMIIFIQFAAKANAIVIISSISVIVFFLWTYVVKNMFRHYEYRLEKQKL
jgi:ATP:ADP antiporter, AAA family